MKLCCHENCSIDDSGHRHCCPATHLLLVAVVVQVVERPLCFRLATPECIHQQIQPDWLLWREPLFVLDYFCVIESSLCVTVCFLKALLFEEFGEFSLGARCDDDIEVCREACVERGDSVADDKNVLVPRLCELLKQIDECVTSIVEAHDCARSVSRYATPRLRSSYIRSSIAALIGTGRSSRAHTQLSQLLRSLGTLRRDRHQVTGGAQGRPAATHSAHHGAVAQMRLGGRTSGKTSPRRRYLTYERLKTTDNHQGCGRLDSRPVSIRRRRRSA